MEVDASEKRKTEIYAGKKEKKKKAATKTFPPVSYAQSEYCGRGLNQSREFLFSKYVSVNHKYA